MRIDFKYETARLINEFLDHRDGMDRDRMLHGGLVVWDVHRKGFPCGVPSTTQDGEQTIKYVRYWDTIHGNSTDIQGFWNWMYFYDRKMSEDDSLDLLSGGILSDGVLKYNNLGLHYLNDSPYIIRSVVDLVFALDISRRKCIRIGRKSRLRHKAITVIPGGKSESIRTWD